MRNTLFAFLLGLFLITSSQESAAQVTCPAGMNGACNYNIQLHTQLPDNNYLLLESFPGWYSYNQS